MNNVSGTPPWSAPVVTGRGRRGRPPRQPSENDIIFSECAITLREELAEGSLQLKDVPKRVRVLPLSMAK